MQMKETHNTAIQDVMDSIKDRPWLLYPPSNTYFRRILLTHISWCKPSS